MDNPKTPPPSLSIKMDDETAKGRFSNLAQVGSTPEVFILDFAFAQGTAGWHLARMLLSPSHAKRFHSVLGEALSKHEKLYGTIDQGPTLQ